MSGDREETARWEERSRIEAFRKRGRSKHAQAALRTSFVWIGGSFLFRCQSQKATSQSSKQSILTGITVVIVVIAFVAGFVLGQFASRFMMEWLLRFAMFVWYYWFYWKMIDIHHVLLLFAIILSYFVGITVYSLFAYVASLIYYRINWTNFSVCCIISLFFLWSKNIST